MSRRLFIAGNWKMNLSPSEADTLAQGLKRELIDETAVDIAVAPTALALSTVIARLKHTNIHISAQNLHPKSSGAFTGEVSGEMLRSVGCEYVLIGHSERRTIFGETDSFINEKCHAAFRSGLLPILCVGETLEERDSMQASSVVCSQIQKALDGLSADQVVAVTIAYEPIWAIGTGRTASPQQAQDMHAIIRGFIRKNYPTYVAEQLRIQYGGSVKPHNAAELLAQPDIDGALVGGAALSVANFVGIIKAAQS
jgi:triosephosphate isomerase